MERFAACDADRLTKSARRKTFQLLSQWRRYTSYGRSQPATPRGAFGLYCEYALQGRVRSYVHCSLGLRN